MKTFQLISLYFCRLLKITWIFRNHAFYLFFCSKPTAIRTHTVPLFLQKILYMYDYTRYCTSTYHNGQNVPIHDRKSGQVVASMYVSLT